MTSQLMNELGGIGFDVLNLEIKTELTTCTSVHQENEVFSFKEQNAKTTVQEDKNEKGIWWMPWLQEAKKDVIGCEKLWLAANTL